jgi:tRNA (uracil-5-)-methyltransferase TRM9
MDSPTVERLLALNREFYDRFGESFSATRQRLQPGVMRILGSLKGDERILDLGCGNGELARALARRGHRGSYLGLDFSLPLLRAAGARVEGVNATFLQGDLTYPVWSKAFNRTTFNLILAFAVLHHIPGKDLRLAILRSTRDMLESDGCFVHSNWQFLNSARLKARIQPWSKIGLSDTDVDEGDYLLDWRRAGEGLRYVHHFSEMELRELAGQARYSLRDSFFSDGEGARLGLYQVWVRA